MTVHDHAATENAAHCEGESCGCHSNPVFDGVDRAYKAILLVVIAINGAMFLVETIAGHLAMSQALKADALDFLGDTLTYGLSLAVIGRPQRLRAAAALAKGLSLTVMGLWVVGSTAWEVFVLGLPHASLMGGIGVLAFAANLASVLLLMRYKDGDANVRSVWLCSRNDAIGNLVVIGAAGLVWATTSPWPDIAVAAIMGGLFLNSSVQILRQAWAEWTTGEERGARAGHGHVH